MKFVLKSIMYSANSTLNMRFNALYIFRWLIFKIQSSFIICLECNSDSMIGIEMVRRACFCLDARFLGFFYRRAALCNISIIQVSEYERMT